MKTHTTKEIVEGYNDCKMYITRDWILDSDSNKLLQEQLIKILDYIQECDDDIIAFDNPQYNAGYEEALKHIRQFIEKIK